MADSKRMQNDLARKEEKQGELLSTLSAGQGGPQGGGAPSLRPSPFTANSEGTSPQPHSCPTASSGGSLAAEIQSSRPRMTRPLSRVFPAAGRGRPQPSWALHSTD